MRKTIQILGMAALAVIARAQLSTTNTTLSVAVPAGTGFNNSPVQWCIASATGVVLPSLASNTSGSILLADREAVQVLSQGSSTTCFNVQRGALGTSANASHASGVTVWVGSQATGSGDTSRPFSGGVFTAAWPSGSCVRANQYSLPMIFTGSAGVDTPAGALIDCVANIWVNAPPQINTINSHTFYTTLAASNSIATHATTDAAATLVFSELLVTAPGTLTGACQLLGATITTDSRKYLLYDAAGNLVAATGAFTDSGGTASVYNCAAFSSPVRVYGPMTYYIGAVDSGTTDTYQTYAAGAASTNYGTGTNACTYATAATTCTSITPSLTFTANQGPIFITY